mmetsp:Transcript_12798/g.31086  ORF Transcript_12798/g.31086 Transcript_12798/m.31086 type:complete len:111 (+) Transcript_12798:76-408(+)
MSRFYRNSCVEPVPGPGSHSFPGGILGDLDNWVSPAGRGSSSTDPTENSSNCQTLFLPSAMPKNWSAGDLLPQPTTDQKYNTPPPTTTKKSHQPQQHNNNNKKRMKPDSA